jgi:hypothetical protein
MRRREGGVTNRCEGNLSNGEGKERGQIKANFSF